MFEVVIMILSLTAIASVLAAMAATQS